MRCLAACLLVLGVGCQDTGPPPAAKTVAKADDCKLFLGKARATLQQMASAAGVAYGPAMEEQALTDCRADLAAGKRSAMIACVLAAKDEPAVHGCFPQYDAVMANKPAVAPTP